MPSFFDGAGVLGPKQKMTQKEADKPWPSAESVGATARQEKYEAETPLLWEVGGHLFPDKDGALNMSEFLRKQRKNHGIQGMTIEEAERRGLTQQYSPRALNDLKRKAYARTGKPFGAGDGDPFQ